MITHKTVTVELGERAYDIHIGAGLLNHAGQMLAKALSGTRVIIVADATVAALYAAPLEASLAAAGFAHQRIEVPAGEGSKSFATLEWLMNSLMALAPDRHTTLIALGGGVIGDLCGFAASILLRGVAFVQIPTTLLAQVDSSVGGKTGINLSYGKNLVGSFYQPRMVLIDTATLATLPLRERRAGYAEIFKYALIADAVFYEWLQANGAKVLDGDDAALTHAIETSCRHKAAIVAADEREGGVRALLNLGHTFGHALEAQMGFSSQLLHGEAVAIGMVLAARLSNDLGLCDESVETHIRNHLHALGMPTSPRDIAPDWNVDALCDHFKSDKKTQSNKLTFIALKSIGHGVVVKDVPPDVARRVVADAV